MAPRPPAGDAWLHEIKLDGYRLLCRKTSNDIRLLTLGCADCPDRLTALVEAVRGLKCRDVWLDGEIVHLDKRGAPDFEALQRDFRSGREGRLFYYAWDMPWFDGQDLTSTPLLQRKQRLKDLLVGASAR